MGPVKKTKKKIFFFQHKESIFAYGFTRGKSTEREKQYLLTFKGLELRNGE